ncbi:hypothetical protein OG413_41030 [Streptomyces sp. NBC_01433]|uniref:hypothetical protein n=1 Tax=Streptomyces sp. NBC_01433 TaxID=2903864 RepID=UPI00224E3085|nr:hypothetical protein [Streptomyces sp. NBC_01433]MCX4681588.1 hypothetical protein [Streptomyces sp. NBC_01433]
MTTPTPLQTEPTAPVPKLSPGAPPGMNAEELARYARNLNLQSGPRRARALDNAAAPPEAGPRDLAGIGTAMTAARSNQAYYFSHPDWQAILNIHQQVDDVLARLNEQAQTTPQTAIPAAKITTLAASLIARHAAKISAHLDKWEQRGTPGGQAMRALTRDAEGHAARASGLDSVQALDTPRLLAAHVLKLSRELRRAEPGDPEQDLGLDDPDDPELDSALSAGAQADPELAEASQLMSALIEMGGRARRAGHRLTLDVRLHGMVETAQLRGFDMISGIAQAVMRRYDNQDRGTDGRRNIAAMIFHYAEQRLERMRGSLGADEQRDFGHYETDPPERYMEALYEESRTVRAELSAKNLRPQDRPELQIRYLLAQKEIAAAGSSDGEPEMGTQVTFPPSDLVAGMQTDSPVETRLALIKALRRQVENNPFHRDAQFLNKVADRFAQEIAGPPELTAQALAADLNADQIRAVATHIVEQGTVASPLVLSENAELNLTHAQAERALAVLQTLNVVGPPNGLKPRETLTLSRKELPAQLELLDQRLPNLLELQKGAAPDAAPPASEAPAPPAQAEAAPKPETPTPAEPAQAQTPAAPAPPAPAPAAPAPAPAAGAEAPTDQDLAQLFEGQEDRVNEATQKLIAGTEARAAAHPAPAETAPAKPTNVDEAQHNAQQNQQTAGVGVH